MREAVTAAELFQVVRHAVRVHRRAAVLSEHKAAVEVVAFEPQPLAVLPRSILAQQLHRRWCSSTVFAESALLSRMTRNVSDSFRLSALHTAPAAPAFTRSPRTAA